MASRNWNDEGVLGVKRCRVDFKFNPQGALAPTFSRDQARGVASITRTGVGTFLVTLEDTFRTLVARVATVQLAAAADVAVQFGTIANVGAALPPTIEVRLVAGAAPVDVAANSENSISVSLMFNDSDTF